MRDDGKGNAEPGRGDHSHRLRPKSPEGLGSITLVGFLLLCILGDAAFQDGYRELVKARWIEWAIFYIFLGVAAVCLVGALRARRTELLASVLIIAVALYCQILFQWFPEVFYWSLEEDEYIEWTTMWAFLAAAIVWVVAAARPQRGGAVKLPWFFLGLALFCFVVAMEEISWGQRLFAYRPPAYFLKENFQQELNVHNVVSTDGRKLMLIAIIAGYGVLFPFLAGFRAVGILARRIGLVPPPTYLVPAFLATLTLYLSYPWWRTAEAVELMLGFGFLFAALSHVRFGTGALTFLGAASACVALGLVTGWVSAQVVLPASADRIATATAEVEALRRDFSQLARTRRGNLREMRNLHSRVYAYMVKFQSTGTGALWKGHFSGLVEKGLPKERAEYFLDPWNLPYWIGKIRSADGRSERAVVYSSGPNRRRESTNWRLLGDDIGVVIYEFGTNPETGRRPG